MARGGDQGPGRGLEGPVPAVLPPCARAREIWTVASRYAASTWRFDNELEAMPEHYLGTQHEFLWQAFKSGAAMPIGERQLRNILPS